jgi:autotransporter-associated beta strand protein
LAKTGAATLVLRGVNTYTGSTLVSTGTVALVGSGAIGDSSTITIASGAVLDVSGRSDGNLTLASGQMLTGNGALYGSLHVSGNAIVAPGGSIGVLTVTNAVTLQGTTFMELDAQNGTNDAIYGAQAINYGGTLVLTNISGALTNGSSFKLFNATNYTGAFVNILPPTPGHGLTWDTERLTSDGTLNVGKGSPSISAIFVSGGNLILSGTNGVAGNPYYLLASTNVALAVINWLRLQTNFFDLNGNFNATSAIDPNLAGQFFLIQEP